MTENRRSTDNGFLCTLALRAGQFWDFVDKRDIDKHLISLAILVGTVIVTRWGMWFAENITGYTGTEVAMLIAAVLAPYMAMQAAALKFYFEARQ